MLSSSGIFHCIAAQDYEKDNRRRQARAQKSSDPPMKLPIRTVEDSTAFSFFDRRA
jgi:hypothetical protein